MSHLAHAAETPKLIKIRKHHLFYPERNSPDLLLGCIIYFRFIMGPGFIWEGTRSSKKTILAVFRTW